MSIPDAKRLRELETENARLKKLLAEQVRTMVDKGLSERRALAIVRMSASHECQRVPLRPTARSQRRAAGADPDAGAAASALRCRDDLPQAEAIRTAREPQARRTAVPGSEAAGAATQAEEGGGKKVAVGERQPLLRPMEPIRCGPWTSCATGPPKAGSSSA